VSPVSSPLRRAKVLLAVVAILAVLPGSFAFGGVSGSLGSVSDPPSHRTAPQVITGGTFGLPTKYTSGSGDTWFNTWSSNGDIFATSNDTSGFNGKCNSDIAVNELAGANPTQLTAPFVNCMTSYGHAGDTSQYPDGCDWKSGGIISVSGTLYLTVARQTGPNCTDAPNGEQPSRDASIVKSTDFGRTWSNSFGTTNASNGAAPSYDPTAGRVQAMFPGQTFTPFFINYGQDDNPSSTANGGATYVYALSTNGFAYDGSDLILGRVLRSEIGNLKAADWQFYTGSPGGNGMSSVNWSSNVTRARPVLTAKNKLSQPAAQYIPSLHRYVLTTFYYPFSTTWPGNEIASQSRFTFYEAPAPWGPWNLFYSQPTTMSVCYMNCQPTNDWPLGLYDPTLVSKFVRIDGLSNILFTSGDFTENSRYDDAKLYALHAFPFTLTSNLAHITDDSSAQVTYTGNWTSGTFDSVGSDYFDNGTVDYTDTPGASVTFGFTGSTVAWIGSTNDNHGYASVSIDGEPTAMVDGYSSQWLHQVTLFQRTGLSPGRHTITITLSSARDTRQIPGVSYMDVDGFVTSGPAHGLDNATFGVSRSAFLPPIGRGKGGRDNEHSCRSRGRPSVTSGRRASLKQGE
jgi:hypothetical protein